MKHIYFVRHGETAANIQAIHQSPEEPLTQKGRKQAGHAALILKHKKIDTIICSTYTRARETAEIISNEVGVPYIIDESVTEFRRPENLHKKSHFSPASLWYVWRMFTHREDARFDDDGAENLFAIRNRVLDAEAMLTHLIGEQIVVVSHTIFMNMFLEMACRERSLTLREFMLTLRRSFYTHNGGIIHLCYDEHSPEGICPWQLVERISN